MAPSLFKAVCFYWQKAFKTTYEKIRLFKKLSMLTDKIRNSIKNVAL